MPSRKATYRSISCELLADAAVLPGIPNGPIVRFTPHAAQRRFESACAERGLSLISRIVFLCFNALSTDVSLPSVGLGNVIDGRFREEAGFPGMEAAVDLLFPFF
jgi:hypothetical protein